MSPTLKKRPFATFYILVISAIAMMPFQNCSSEVAFSNAPTVVENINNANGGSEPMASPTPEPYVVTPFNIEFSTETKYRKVDILFVIDESSSMNSIIENIKAGFSGLQELDYPLETRMAVMNTAPAKQDASGTILYDQPFKGGNIIHMPGYLQLVTGASIANYLAKATSPKTSRFPLKGCDNGWFYPKDKNSDDQYCLDAAVQVVGDGIGTEAGGTAFHQFLNKLKSENKKLFRDGALANVVYVSDTHDPGDNFYGRTMAPSRMPTIDEIKADVESVHGSDLAGFKVSGIVPIPSDASSSVLDGLNVVGNYGGALTSEGTYGYSYLNYIKATNGVVMHPVQAGNDFKPAILQLLAESAYSEVPSYELPMICGGMLSVNFNDELLEAADFELFNNGLGLRILKSMNGSGVFKVSCE